MAQCTAKAKSTQERCTRPAIKGGTVCRFHGGGAPQVKNKALQRILEAADPAAAELIRLATGSKDERTRLAAVRDLLDRASVKAEVGEEGKPKRLIIEWPE